MKNLIVAALLLFSGSAYAQTAGGFFSTVGIVGGMGNVSNKDKSIPKIDLLYTELLADFGYSFGTFAPLLQASYRYVGQSTNPETVGNINMGGSGYLLGAGFGIEGTTLKFSAVYDLAGNYALTKEGGGGSKVAYGAPAGFHVNLKYLSSGSWYWLFSFSQVDYKERSTAGTPTKIETNPVTMVLYGIGLGYRF